MRLSEIQMEGFRGYPACCPLKLDYDVVIIFGDNGSGKSSLFNAIEWLLEDTVDLGDCRDAKTGDRFRNLFTGCEEPWVKLTFSEIEAGRTVQYQVTRRLKAGTSQTSDVKKVDELLQATAFPNRLLSRKALDEKGIAYNWPLRYGQGEFEQVFLNRKRLGKFIEVKASERGGQLFKLLGYGILGEYRNTIDQLLTFLRQYGKKEELENTLGDCCAILLDKIKSVFEKHSELPQDIQASLSVVQELLQEIRGQIEAEYPCCFAGLRDLLAEQSQRLQDEHNLTPEEQEEAEEELHTARTAFVNQQSLLEFFSSQQWINPTEYEVIDADTWRLIRQRLSGLPDLLDRTRRFRDNPDMFDLEVRLGFLEYGLALVEKGEGDTCPFCLQDITGQWDEAETVKEHFTNEHRAFLEKYQGLNPQNNLIEDVRQACDSLQTIVDCKETFARCESSLRTLFGSLEAKAGYLGETASSPDFEAISGSALDFSSPQELLERLDLALEFVKAPEEVEFPVLDELSCHIEASGELLKQLEETQQATHDVIDNLNSQHQETRETLEDKMQQGLEAQVERWQERLEEFYLLDALRELEEEAARLEAIANKTSSLNKYIRLLLDARDLLKDAEESLMKEALERISDRVNGIYRYMNPDEALNRIIFRPTGGRDVDLIVDDENVDLCDKEPKPPAFLSEGHLNCLGIAIHLALQEVIDSPFDFVVFDDPLYSIDAGHRRKALDAIFDFAKKARRQLLIATHDPLFFHYLKEKLRLRHKDFDSRQVYLVVNHSSTEPHIIEEGSSESFLQAAKEKLQAGCDSYAIESVYVLMRREIEYICDRLLEGQRVAEYGKEYDNLDSRIELLRELECIDEVDIGKLHEARIICNPAAHYDPQRESYTVARQVLGDIEAFRNTYLSEPSEG